MVVGSKTLHFLAMGGGKRLSFVRALSGLPRSERASDQQDLDDNGTKTFRRRIAEYIVGQIQTIDLNSA